MTEPTRAPFWHLPESEQTEDERIVTEALKAGREAMGLPYLSLDKMMAGYTAVHDFLNAAAPVKQG